MVSAVGKIPGEGKRNQRCRKERGGRAGYTEKVTLIEASQEESKLATQICGRGASGKENSHAGKENSL